MITNLAECMNNVFKGVKYIPVLGLVKATFYKLSYYVDKHSMTIVAYKQVGETILEVVNKKIVKNVIKASSCIVCVFD